MLLLFLQWRSQWSCEVLWSHAPESPTCSSHSKPHLSGNKPCVQTWASSCKSCWSDGKKSRKALKGRKCLWMITIADKTNCWVSFDLPPSTLPIPQVSELRQQLRKRGLPVSGTKPALLQRLRPFQLPHSCPTPAPLCQLGTSLEPLTPCPSLPLSQSPGSSSSSRLDSPSSSPNQQMYIPDRGIPHGIVRDAPNGVPEGILNTTPNGFSNAVSVSLAGEHCGLTNAVFLAPASTASGTPSPSLPMSSSSPLQCGTPWRTENEQQELSVEMEMKERLRSRPRDRSTNTSNEVNKDMLRSLFQDVLENSLFIRMTVFQNCSH